jgi:hypothetical protein
MARFVVDCGVVLQLAFVTLDEKLAREVKTSFPRRRSTR